MRRVRSKSSISPKPDWARTIFELRQRLKLSQSSFGQLLHASAMAVSRWERGSHEPAAGSYIELGILAGAPLCWYFWGRAGLRNEDLMRVMPSLREGHNRADMTEIQIVSAGSGAKKSEAQQLVAIPLLKVMAASHGEKGDNTATLNDGPVEGMIAAPKDWCPNPDATTCLRMRGNSMMPLISDGYIVAVDSSQTYVPELNGKVVIAWHKDMGLMVSRLQEFDHTEVLQPESGEHKPILLNNKHKWKILAKVLWWIGKAP